MSKCHWIWCERPSVPGKFSIMDEVAKRKEFCSADHRQLFMWLNMPQPERQKPFPDVPTVVEQLISTLKRE